MGSLFISNWKKDNQQLKWDIEIPANSMATIYIPNDLGEDLLESGKAIEQCESWTLKRKSETHFVYQVISGNFKISVK